MESQNIEYFLDEFDGNEFQYNFKNNLLKFNDINGNFTDNPLFDFNDLTHYQDNILNGDPNFKNIDNNQFIIGEDSEAKAQADVNAALQIPFDILNVNRTSSPDIGAYQHIIFEEN